MFISILFAEFVTLDYDPEKMCIKILKTYAREKDLKKFLKVVRAVKGKTFLDIFDLSNSLTIHPTFNYPDKNP